MPRSTPRVRQLWMRVVATRRRARLAVVRVAAIETETRLAGTAAQAGERTPPPGPG